MSEPVARVFFALVPPPALRRELGDMARALAHRLGGRPVPAENIHLTLAFVGAWPVARLGALLEIGASLRSAEISLALDRIGGFRNAGVAWIGCSAAPASLLALAEALEHALSAAGVAVEERAFHPHLTLVRKTRGPFAHEAVGTCAWTVDALTLMSSETRAEGARYRALGAWPLA